MPQLAGEIKHPEPREAGELPRSVRLGSTSPTTAALPQGASSQSTPGQSQHPSSDALAIGQPPAVNRGVEARREPAQCGEVTGAARLWLHGGADSGPR